MKGYIKTFANIESAHQFLKTGLVGAINTVVSFALFNISRVLGLSIFWSVTFGWMVATTLSYVLNRRWSFRVTAGSQDVGETARFFVVNLLAWGATVGLMKILQWQLGPLNRIGENIALLLVGGIILLPKFATYRDVVFRKALAKQERAASRASSRADVL